MKDFDKEMLRDYPWYEEHLRSRGKHPDQTRAERWRIRRELRRQEKQAEEEHRRAYWAERDNDPEYQRQRREERRDWRLWAGITLIISGTMVGWTVADNETDWLDPVTYGSIALLLFVAGYLSLMVMLLLDGFVRWYNGGR